MSTRTDAENALERLAWTLNFHRGETISVNKLATKTGLSWATAQKYTKLLEVLNRIAPSISVGEDGISVTDVGKNLQSLQDQEDLQLLVYLLTQAEIEGGPMEPLDIGEHSDVLHKYRETIGDLARLGWIEHGTSTITLKPEGAAIAGPARSRLRNGDTRESPEIEIVHPAEVIEFDEESEPAYGGPLAKGTASRSGPVPATGTAADYKRVDYRKSPYLGKSE